MGDAQLHGDDRGHLLNTAPRTKALRSTWRHEELAWRIASEEGREEVATRHLPRGPVTNSNHTRLPDRVVGCPCFWGNVILSGSFG